MRSWSDAKVHDCAEEKGGMRRSIVVVVVVVVVVHQATG